MKVNGSGMSAQVKYMARERGMKQVEIAAELGISRQLVNYHLSDKAKRRRKYIGKKRKAVLQAKARARYRRKTLEDIFA